MLSIGTARAAALGWAGAGWLMWAGSGQTAVGAEWVRARLEVPAAPTRVIGDPIPLIWHFESQSPAALAFLWEGCCRLNGRLDVTRAGKGMEPVPPGPSTAHQFSRPTLLQPGQSSSFETRLSDWARLTKSGTYRLEGHYVGVLPEQKPPVPPGVELWRGEATTPPIEIEVLDVDDYLDQRVERSVRHEVVVELSGPHRVAPLKPLELGLTVRNFAAKARTLNWPHDLRLWVVTREGDRVATSSSHIRADFEEVVIPPGGAISRSIVLPAGDLVGEALADYRMFVDLSGMNGLPARLPSNMLQIDWSLGGSEVLELVRKAAEGPATGLRNLPLKTLRVYLADLREVLEGMDPGRLDGAAPALLDDLKLAARLKPIQPEPGHVNLEIRVSATNGWRFEDPRWNEALEATGAGSLERIGRILEVRRHLGWSLGVGIDPAPEATLETISAVFRDLQDFEGDWSSPPLLRAGSVVDADAGRMVFRASPVPANLVLRATVEGDQLKMRGARRIAGAGHSPAEAMFRPEEMATLSGEPIASEEDLLRWIEEEMPSKRLLVMVDGEARWEQLAPVLGPLSRRVPQLNLAIAR